MLIIITIKFFFSLLEVIFMLLRWQYPMISPFMSGKSIFKKKSLSWKSQFLKKEGPELTKGSEECKVCEKLGGGALVFWVESATALYHGKAARPINRCHMQWEMWPH